MKWSEAEVADVPPMSVTVTSTVPADPAGDVAEIRVVLMMLYLSASVPPNCTKDSSVKPVPVIITEVPPAVEPAVAESVVTVGGTIYVYLSE